MSDTHDGGGKRDWFEVQKKPVVVEADGPHYRQTVVDTLEGEWEVDEEYAREGFYVVRGVEGEVYVVRSDIFQETYQTVDGEEIECQYEDCTDPVDPRTGYCCLEHERYDNA